QAPMVPERLLGRIGAALLVGGAIALAWVAVVRPAIDDAAADAVADQPIATATTIATPTTDVTGGTGGTASATETEGTPFATVLTSGSPAGQTSVQDYVVPAGSTLLLSDYLVQNPFGDAGMARLRIGDRELEWDLAVHLDGTDVSNRLVTPLAIEAGESVSFQVDCGAVGQEGGTGCSATALVVGRLVPV
ncbi:MAG: hypothetical protein WD023_03155, partial [Ilumatobacteraceae bacterium]